MDQDETWHGGRPQPHIVSDGDLTPLPQVGHSPLPQFWPMSVVANGCVWMDQDATWYGAKPRPRRHCVRWGSSSPPQKGGTAAISPIFNPCIVAIRLDGSSLLWPNGRPSQLLLSTCYTVQTSFSFSSPQISAVQLKFVNTAKSHKQSHGLKWWHLVLQHWVSISSNLNVELCQLQLNIIIIIII